MFKEKLTSFTFMNVKLCFQTVWLQIRNLFDTLVLIISIK